MAGTFIPINLDHDKYDRASREGFIKKLKGDLIKYRNDRLEFYEKLRDKNNADSLRWWMGILAVVATIFSAIAAGLRVSTVSLSAKQSIFSIPADKFDLIFFGIALLAFAVLSGLAVYDRMNDFSTAYFRHNLMAEAIRDLWTPLEFELFKELKKQEKDSPVSDSEFEHLMKTASAFCVGLNKLTSEELSDFKSEFIQSMKDLDTLASKGLKDSTAELEKAVKAHKVDADKAKEEVNKAKKAAEEAAKKAEQAAQAAREAAEAATKPGYLNITVKGDYDSKLTIKVNGKEHSKVEGKNFSIGDLKQGIIRLELIAKKGDKIITYDKYLTMTAGLQNEEVTLT